MPGTGSGILDFGAFPGASDASVTITGLTGIGTTSLVEAFVLPSASTDHSADEHMLETLNVFADQTTIVAGTSCAVKGFNTNQVNEPIEPRSGGGRGTRLYGKFNVGLAWS
jgi:hypothetical protein